MIGVSNFNVALLDEAVTRHGADLPCNQVEFHPFLSQRLVLAAVKRLGPMLTADTPRGRGHVQRNAALAEIGRKYGKSAAQVALRWLINQENVAAIPKAGSPGHAAVKIEHLRFQPCCRGSRGDRRAARQPRVVDPGAKWDPP